MSWNATIYIPLNCVHAYIYSIYLLLFAFLHMNACPMILKCNDPKYQFFRRRNIHGRFDRKTCNKKKSVRDHIEIN